MVIVAVSPSDGGACTMMRELDAEISSLYPDSVIFGIDEAEFEKAGGYFVIAQHPFRAGKQETIIFRKIAGYADILTREGLDRFVVGPPTQSDNF